MEVIRVGGGAPLDRPCMVFKECVCCACDPSVHLDVPSMCLCMSEVIYSFRSLRAGSQVFSLLMLFLCVIWHSMWSGKSMQMLCILPFYYIVFVCHQNDVCENYIGSVHVDGYCGLVKTDSVSSVNCAQSNFLSLVKVRRLCCSL